MVRDNERVERVKSALREAGLDALVCARPSNVLLLSGYWPVVGTSIAIATKEGRIGLIVPEDEEALAAKGWADELLTFKAGSLDELSPPLPKVVPAIQSIRAKLAITGRVGYEHAEAFEPISYAAMHRFGSDLPVVLGETLSAGLVPADLLIEGLRAVLTRGEVQRLRVSCRLAEEAFEQGKEQLHPELTEREAADAFRRPLIVPADRQWEIERAEGFVFCMSGPNAAKASAAYQRSQDRRLRLGEFILVHCNSCADGYWTDVTRTYVVGEITERQDQWLEAVLEARRAALLSIGPGIRAAEVDRAAREVLESRGYDKEFRHGTGHGVGFSAINHLAQPRLHPASEDVLETGMVFNIEPGLYADGYGGLRHCDMVLVTEHGAEVMTPFQFQREELILLSPAREEVWSRNTAQK